MRWLRWLRWTLVGLAVLAALAFATGWWVLNRSLPRLDGDLAVAGLGAEATIERDARGVPVISARTRVDLAFATGYAHAQDRFFQMDLSRRLAAGELSELFGAAALRQDVRARRFGFRGVARRVLEAAPPEERAVIEAYARGVNAGLASLATRPWEYLLLRASPRAWAAEDSALVVHAMWWQLQFGSIRQEIGRRRLERAAAAHGTADAGRQLLAFAYAGHSSWDTPNYTADARCVLASCGESARAALRPLPALLRFAAPPAGAPDHPGEEPKPGSNGWAVSGIHTKSGVALVANDMHLDLGVPTTWYPARLRVTTDPSIDVTGVTLPGTPAVAAGSNGQVAWGFTNSYGDYADLRFGECAGADSQVRRERIAVRGAEDAQVDYRDLAFAVVLDGEEFADDVAAGRCLQLGWMAARPEATNFALLGVERALNVDEVLALAPRIGIPAQNLVIGDTGGRIAWTVAGRVARSSGPDRYFDALVFRDATDHPRIADPPVGRLWTANQRIVDGPLEAVLGDDEVEVGADGYDIGARARQIRDGLLGLTHPATAADMLAIQLDARASFLARWRELLLALIDEPSMHDTPRRREFRELVSEWQPEAAPDSVGYRLVRAFRDHALDALWRGLVAGLLGPDAELRRPAQFEAAGWRLVTERPAAIAPPPENGATDWRTFLLLEVDRTIADLVEQCGSLVSCTYGDGNPVRVRHPLARAVPMLSRLLDMPTRELPGDHHMPRVQDGHFGASERFAVSPGREDEAYLQLPGGPSGHPLSPFYRSGFEDWAAGRPTPFLPGPAAHKLRLEPEVAQ